MILYLKTRGFNPFGRRSVTDEYGDEEYYTEHSFYSEGSVFSGSERYHDVSIMNVALEEAVRLERSNRNRREITICVGDEKVSTVKRNMYDFHLYYSIPGLGWEMTSNFWGTRYVIKKGESYIAVVKYKGTQGPGYEMDILNPNNAELVLAVVVAKTILDDEHRRNRNHHIR